MPIFRYTVTGGAENTSSRLGGLGSKASNTEQTAIRIKARYQSVDIMPMAAYDEFTDFLTGQYLPLCTTLEPILGVKAKVRAELINHFLFCRKTWQRVSFASFTRRSWRRNSSAISL